MNTEKLKAEFTRIMIEWEIFKGVDFEHAYYKLKSNFG